MNHIQMFIQDRAKEILMTLPDALEKELRDNPYSDQRGGSQRINNAKSAAFIASQIESGRGFDPKDPLLNLIVEDLLNALFLILGGYNGNTRLYMEAIPSFIEIEFLNSIALRLYFKQPSVQTQEAYFDSLWTQATRGFV